MSSKIYSDPPHNSSESCTNGEVIKAGDDIVVGADVTRPTGDKCEQFHPTQRTDHQPECTPTPTAFRLQHAVICRAVFQGKADVVRAVTKNGFDINSFQIGYMYPNPLHLACYLGRRDTIELFLEQRPNLHQVARINDEGPKSAFAYMLRHDDVELMKPWLEFFMRSRDLYARTAMHIVAEEGAFRCLKYLLKTQQGDIDARDFSGQTPLMFAVRHSFEFVKLLLDSNVCIWVKTRNRGRQILHMLFAHDHAGARFYLSEDTLSIADALIAAGADVNAVDSDYATPLSLLCRQIGPELNQMTSERTPSEIDNQQTIIKNCIQLLIVWGATVNSINHGNTPLNVTLECFKAGIGAKAGRYAVDTDIKPYNVTSTIDFSVTIMEMLLRHGSDPDARNTWGDSPLTQILVYLQTIRFISDKTVGQILAYIGKAVRVLLLYGARVCILQEALTYEHQGSLETYKGIISLVLNALSPSAYYQSIKEVIAYLDNSRDPGSQDNPLCAWARQAMQEPRTLKQLARCQICQFAQGRLVDLVPILPLPAVLKSYVLSFEG